MHIERITCSNYYNREYENNSSIRGQSYGRDTVSFGIDPGTALVILVLKAGYKALKPSAKLKFYHAVDSRIANPDTSNNAKQIVDTLYVLAKSAPDTKGDSDFRRLRNKALQLFSLVPEFKNDANRGHAAKLALLESMIDTGEYAVSDDFYDIFTKLPSHYKQDKIFLMKKMLRDKNVSDNAFEFYANRCADEAFSNQEVSLLDCFRTKSWKDSYKKENENAIRTTVENSMKTANAAIFSTLDIKNDEQFLNDYSESLQALVIDALEGIREKIKTSQSCNDFFKAYSDGFHGYYPYGYSYYEKRLMKLSYLNFISDRNINKDALMKEFNIPKEKYYEELVKDYNLVVQTSQNNNIEEVKKMFNERLREKETSDNVWIRDSGEGLLSISERHYSLIKSLLDQYKAQRPKPAPAPIKDSYLDDIADYRDIALYFDSHQL